MTKHTKIELDQIEMVDDLRTIWPDEARNFTPWLSESENLELLGEAIGRNLQLSETGILCGGFFRRYFWLQLRMMMGSRRSSLKIS